MNTEEEVKTIINEMMMKKDHSVNNIVITDVSSKGENYLGEVYFAKVDTTKNGIKKNYNFVIKTAKKSEELRKQSPIKEVYEREIFMYTKVFPVFLEFQKEISIEKSFHNVAKCFTARNENKKETLIFENLKTLGFDLHDRKTPMNLNHAHMVISTYAKYHSISLALKIKQPSLFKSITKNLSDLMGTFIIQGKMTDNLISTFKNGIQMLYDDGHLEAVKKLKTIEPDIEYVLTKSCRDDKKWYVITHGDCWNNNMMFKYDGINKNKPTDMRFLDFQLSRLASPVLDLSYYLYACTDRRVLQDFDFLLQVYHSTLSEKLNEYGIDVDDVISYKELLQEWKQWGKFGLFLVGFILKIALCDVSEAPDFAEAAENGEGFEGALDIQIKDTDAYDGRVKDIMLHFAEKFL